MRHKLLFDRLKIREQEDDKITATVRDEFCNRMDLTFFGAEWYAQEEEMPTRILFTEVLWENGKLLLNILTRTNEYSILAEDVKCVWVDENEFE